MIVAACSVTACRRIHNATSGYALKMIEAGYQFVTLASDSRFYGRAAARGGFRRQEVGMAAGSPLLKGNEWSLPCRRDLPASEADGGIRGMALLPPAQEGSC